MLGRFFKNKANAAKAELKKVENRDLMEAIIGGSILVAAADGSISDDELLTLEKAIAANPALKHFGREIHDVCEHFKELVDVGFRMAKMKILREIADIKDSPQEAEECFVNCLIIAESDGEIDPEELKILKEIASTLGVRVSDFIIE